MRLMLNFFKNIYNNQKSLIIFIFLVSIIFSVIFLIFFRNIGPVEHKVPNTDYIVRYEPIANNILQGKGITLEGKVRPEFAPGFPVILAGIFALSKLTGIDRLDLVVVFNIIFTAIACYFLFLIAKEIFNKKIALVASFLWMSYPFNLWFIKNPNTEVPFIPLLYLGIFLYVLALKRRDLRLVSLGGLILGLSSLTRLTSLFLPLFLALMIFFLLRGDPKRRQFLLVIILLIGNLVAILPWGIYAFSKTGSFVPVSSLETSSIVGGVTFLSSKGQGGDQVVLPNNVTSLIERAKAEDLSSRVKIFQFFIKEFGNNPITFLKLIGLKLVRSWYGTSEAWWEDKILIVQSFYLIASLMGIVYGIKIYKDKVKDIILLLGIIFYFWGLTFLVISILRYTIPVMGLVVIFSAITVNVVIDKLVKKFRPRLLCPL